MKSIHKQDSHARPDVPVCSTGVTGEGYVYDGCRHTLSSGWSRRGFIETLGLTGATLAAAPLASLLLPGSAVAGTALEDFTFAILADSHTMGKKNSPMKVRLEAAIKQINAMNPAPRLRDVPGRRHQRRYAGGVQVF